MIFKYYKKVISFSLIFTMIFNVLTFAEDKTLNIRYDNEEHLYSGPFINLVVNDEQLIDLPLEPIVINERTLVPAREVFEALGANVMWVDNTQQILVTYDEINVILQIGNEEAIVNGKTLILDLPPKIIYYENEEFGKTMIPIRFVAEHLGFDVGWDEPTQTVTIGNKVIELPEVSSPDDDIILVDENDLVENSNVNENENDNDNTIIIDSENNGNSNENENDNDNENINSNENGNNDDEIQKENNDGEAIDLGLELAKDVSPMILTEENHSKTNVYNITMPSATENYVILKTTSKMSKVTKSLLYDNRLILDIYDAELALVSDFEVPDEASFTEFRISQNQIEPDLITRAVLQLEEGVNYFVQFNDDRTELIIGFEKNIIHNVDVHTDGEKDYIEVTGLFAPDVIVSKSSHPKQLHVSMPNSTLEKPLFLELDGIFSKSVYTSSVNGMQTVFINLSDDVQYTVTKEENKTTITLGDVSYENITYVDNSLIIENDNITLDNVTYTDNYLQNQYVVTINKNIEHIVGIGTLQINDSFLRNIDIVHYDNKTEFVFNTNKFIGISPKETNQNIFFEVKSPREIYDKIILIDAGHGGSAPGTTGNGLIEKEININVAHKLKTKLEANTNIKVYMTRLDDVNPGFQERVDFANEVADLFFSIHANAAVVSTAKGTETYYYPHHNDDTIGITSKRVAEIVQEHCLNQLGTFDRGVKQSALFVIKNTEVPAILSEIAFVSNTEDAKLLKSEEFLDKAAYALYLSVIDVFNEFTPKR